MANRNRRRRGRLRTTVRPGGAGLGRKPSLGGAQASPFAQGGLRPRATSPGQQWVNNYQDTHQAKPGLGAPAPAPPAAEPPKGKKPEFDQMYFDRIAGIDRRTTDELGSLDARERRIKFDFGIEDPTNPFNRAQAMKQFYLRRARGTSVGLAAQGHLYSGAHERAMANVRFDEERANAQLRQAYEDALGQIRDLRTNVKRSAEDARADEFMAWLARAGVTA
jgi:hypothetical protein